jgi:hypothetical protein
MFCFRPLISNPTAQISSRGVWQRPTVFLCSGAVAPIDAAVKLTGDHQFLNSECQTTKEEHQANEKLTTNSPSHLVCAEEK